MGTRTDLSAWEIEQIRARIRSLLLRTELSARAIAAATGYNERSVFRIKRKLGIKAAFRHPTDEAILTAARAGKGIAKIAETLGGSTRRIARVIDAAGVKRRKPNERWPGDRKWTKSVKGA